MRTPIIPSALADPNLRVAVEHVLDGGETLASFVERAIRDKIVQRTRARSVGAGGRAAGGQGRRADDFRVPDDVLSDFDAMLAEAAAKPKQ